ncbi:terminal uridylyltransferase Tailor-like [Chironomus tepperi]|uniref:terminal uridylyltransferase Tailor-like n=1 Tax=Chironomus tepperi TaxID=113505 RepID=UPI00391F570E
MPNRKTEKFINLKSPKLVEKAVLEAEMLKSMFNYTGISANLNTILINGGMSTKIHFYGSRVIGLAQKDSDLDIYIEYGDNFNSDKNVERDRQVLEKIVSIIENAVTWKITAKILTASVPILQVIYVPNNIKCDISVSNGLGVANSLMMAHLFNLQPEAKKFYQFMKIFLKRYRDFDGYLLKLLIIFFLQHEKLFPSGIKIQENLPITYINGWPTVEIDAARNLLYYGLNEMNGYKTYIPKFFEFYSKLEYPKYVMSTYEGKQLMRINYEYPEEFEEHFLCIYGPINRRHNIGKYLTKSSAEYFIKLCQSLEREFIMKYKF